MGDDWEDDEWDVDDDEVEKRLEAKRKEDERARRREEGEESEEEDEEPTPAAAPVPGGAPKAKPKPKKKKNNQPAEPVPEEPKLSAQEEKLRRRKLELEADDRLADDLFSGCAKADAEIAKEEEEKKRKEAEAEEAERKRKEEAAKKMQVVIVDQFESVVLDKQADVEQLCADSLEKLNKGKAKDSGGRFLTEVLKQLEPLLTFAQLTEVEKLLAGMCREKQSTKGAVDAKNNKANTKLSKTTKFNASAEVEEKFNRDEDWTQEEWDDWEKQQGGGEEYTAEEWAAWEKSQKK